ncbi:MULTISPECIES: hypothetical protein [Calothrix]|uniref:Uncharacterized protein n=2 Tax=Calothrix TaxID=1186 RepID=A0ABR8AHI0_9CYAN|nr:MULTISPECIES: hypothetical protein [Calothrix]MBD2199476.1 hypothetical protein [Calothrix parietina FACHB-288]MBD2228144.1 hypothetical protein [Calothrix anomala FACHB-343]
MSGFEIIAISRESCCASQTRYRAIVSGVKQAKFMQILTTTSTSPNSTSTACKNPHITEKVTSNLSDNTNLDSGTIAILEQIEAEYEYYQVCQEW